MAGEITFTGLSSNIDLNTIIDALVAARRSSHITPLENWKTDWETKLESISAIDSALASFYTTVRGMDRINELLVRTASSSNETVLTASADSTAVPGAHTLLVGSDIKHRIASDGKTDQDVTHYADAGESFKITVGGSNETITFGSDSNLDEMVTEINDHSTLATAEVINDGSSSNKYRLVLTSKTGGSAGSVTVSVNTTNVNFNMAAAQRVDSAELAAGWGGSGTVTSGGQYLGTTNKSFRFTVSGTGTKAIGTDPFDVTWTDGEGNSGTVNVTALSYSDLSVYQGLTISFEAATETIVGGDTFSVDVWHNDLQAGQDEGVAQVEQEVHSGFSDSDTTAVTTVASTLSYTYNGRSTTIDVGSGTTLTELKDLINNDADNPGVTANIINDGMGLSSSYHLVLTGESTGAAYKISSISHTLNNFGATFTESQAAQNAMIKVDGYPSGDSYLQRATNHITDALTGVTMDVNDSGTATLTVGTDTSATIEKIEAFKDAFNNVRTAIREATLYNAETGETGSLLGNYAVQIIQSKLNNLIAGTAPGFQDPDDTYVNLQQLGFSTDVEEGSETEGLLLLDTTILTEALNSNPDAVVDVFSAYFEGLSNDSQIAYQSCLPSITSAGIYDVEVDTATIQGRFKLSTEATYHPWIALTGSSGDYTLTGAAGYAEQGLALHITYTDALLHSAEVRLKNGVVTQMGLDLEDLLSTSGPLNTLDGSYNDIVTNIEKRIAQEEDRLDHYEALLRQRFVRLDSYMNQMTQLGNYLTQYVANLSK